MSISAPTPTRPNSPLVVPSEPPSRELPKSTNGTARRWFACASESQEVECPRFRGHLRAFVEGRGPGGEKCGRTRPPYPDEFRREAIELARISSKSQRQIAEDLGISDVTLRNWVKQAERDAGKRPDGLSTDEREELVRLRRENQTLRMEREILKKAAAFFARETGEP
jgi:transposase